MKKRNSIKVDAKNTENTKKKTQSFKSIKEDLKVWVVSVDMGYGHQRAAYPLKDIAYERIITANNDKIISDKDHKLWEQSRTFYEFMSRLKSIPIIGVVSFWFYDWMFTISPFFPFRDLSKPNFSVLRLKKLLKNGLCESIVEYTSQKDIPIITTQFIPAMAYNYKNKEVYCIVTDTDINRVWVCDDPKNSKITYFSPCRHVTHRLKQYSVSEDMIIETGFPLPKENIGTKNEIIKKDILARIHNLDPTGTFIDRYDELIKEKLSIKNIKDIKKYNTHPFTITYTIGGAGAQSDIGLKILHSLKDKIIKGWRLNIIVGTKLDLAMKFKKVAEELDLQKYLDKNINIIFALDKKNYFAKMNEALRTTDVLWTKPSEMTLYTALGIPIIIAPPIGSHENYNMKWLEHTGGGFLQENPDYCHEWISYWLEDGRLAAAALHGFINAPSRGTYNIENYLKSKDLKLSNGKMM